jgi:molybdenum cofactor synthesis domain-containing protein
MSAPSRPTAAVVIIGDEVLSGKVQEQNVAFFIERFRMLGVELSRVVIVGDAMDDIGVAVRDASERFDHVCTTGGVGPTHDDITMDAIAVAFGVELIEDPTLLGLVDQVFGESASEGHRRLARLPKGAHLEGVMGPPWPTVVFRNIIIFPGIPRLLRAKFEGIAERFAGQPAYWGHLEIRAREVDICERLEVVVAAHADVEIGSYPNREDDGWWTRLTVECLDEDRARVALDALTAAFGSDAMRIGPVRASNRQD